MLPILMAVVLNAGPARPPAFVEPPTWPAGLPGCATAGKRTRYYPTRAARSGVEGEVILFCGVGGDGRFAGCRVFKEYPKGESFAAAALAMARCDSPGAGAPLSTVTLPVHFRISGSAQPKAPDGVTITAPAPR